MSKDSGILVTGGSGFIGSHLLSRLSEIGYPLVCLDLRVPRQPVPGVEYLQGDVRDPSVVQRVVEKAAAVFHLAAEVSVPRCQTDPVGSTLTNFNSTILLGECLRKRQTTHPKMPVFFASSSAVYGDLGDKALAQESEPVGDPVSYYGAQKRFSEIALHLAADVMHGIAFRFFNVYGPGQVADSPYSGVISRFCAMALEQKPIAVFGDGEQTRDFVFVNDVVDCLVLALKNAATLEGGVFNVASGHSVSINALADTIEGIVGRKLPRRHDKPRPGDIRHSRSTIARVQHQLGWQPKTPLVEGLRRTIEWLKKPDAATF